MLWEPIEITLLMLVGLEFNGPTNIKVSLPNDTFPGLA